MNKPTLSLKAFTLIELLIVIVIIGILAVALIPRLVDMQGRARDTARKSDVRQIQSAFALYASENYGNYPISKAKCLGLQTSESCWLGYTRHAPDETSGFSGSTQLTTDISYYLSSIPRDPLSGREVGDKYIYYNYTGATRIHCGGTGEEIQNKAFIARQPEKISPTSDEQCAPGKYACCSLLGCTSFTDNTNFCVLQLN